MLTGVVTFLLLLIALLAIPVTLTFKMTWQQNFQSDVRLLWLFGLVRARIPITPTSSPKENKPAKKGNHPKRFSSKKQNAFSVVKQKAFRQRMSRFIRDLWHSIQKKDVNLRLRIGLGDPADTGQLWAFVGPVTGMLSNVPETSINIEPDFYDSTFEMDSSGNIRLIPLQLIYLAAGLLLSPPVWREIIKMRTSKK